ncbi:Bacteriophage N adsorption protein A C-term [Paraburkholderia fungorum]|uniref:Bacteriophage N adsorption protein A C-term n=1 Tax=Paraburkholderia fungorum TaxID=134537 RepID=A0A1H1ICJ4_9BURK|nr:bacteriophage N4 adsorption protein A [Paraburkholderia fungorum]SDR35380.1 Bacteriophage N adsorption protein A C-term [Paraburkholderia fungorum]
MNDTIMRRRRQSISACLGPRWRSWAAAWAVTALAAIPALPVHADENLPLPLEGAAYRVAQSAYQAYGAHRYAESASLAREAIRQRPDLVELRLLLANSLAAGGHREAASRELSSAIAMLGAQPALTGRRAQIDRLIAAGDAGGDTGDLNSAAFKAAGRAYRAYAQKDYEAAISASRDAIGEAPDAERLRYLLIDALLATNQDADAYAEAVDATRRFGDSEALRQRRDYVGARLGQQLSIQASAARERGDLPGAMKLAQQAVDHAPNQFNFRLQLIDLQFGQGDLAGVGQTASGAIEQNDRDVLAWTLRGYARAALQEAGADSDFAHALSVTDASANTSPRTARIARMIIADVWIAQGRAQAALDLLAPLAQAHDDTDAAISLRRHRAHAKLREAAPAASATIAIDPKARPVFDCRTDQFGAACDLYAADPGFDAARKARLAASQGDRRAAVEAAREAVAAAPDDPQHRTELIDALVNEGDERGASVQARSVIDAGLLDGMTDMQAGFIAQRAGDSRLALHYFEQADQHGDLPASAFADAGYAALHAHRNPQGAAYLERAIDAGTHPADGEPAATPQTLADERAAHAEATRNWGFNTSLNYRNGGAQPGFASNPVPGVANNWQTATEAWWRPFGSLGDRDFQVYARGYENFGVKGDEPSGADTLQAAVGARVKPFSSVNAVFAFERIVPIGASVRSDWLARAAWSDGFGTALRIDRPSWWTGIAYAEAGRYLQHPSTYATANARLGRTFRLDSVDPNLTVFPHLVVGADYDSAVDHSVPVGIGAGVSTRWWFRGGPYDAPRSFVDLSVQYRFRVAGDARARGVFFGAVLAY